MCAPTLKRRTEDAKIRAGRRQMRSQRQAIRPGPDDGCFHHYVPQPADRPETGQALSTTPLNTSSAIFTDG
jgi:hypothetical protein